MYDWFGSSGGFCRFHGFSRRRFHRFYSGFGHRFLWFGFNSRLGRRLGWSLFRRFHDLDRLGDRLCGRFCRWLGLGNRFDRGFGDRFFCRLGFRHHFRGFNWRFGRRFGLSRFGFHFLSPRRTGLRMHFADVLEPNIFCLTAFAHCYTSLTGPLGLATRVFAGARVYILPCREPHKL